jgi:rhamnulokinase
MSEKLNFIACDLGAESGRTILGEFDGNELSLQEVYRFSNIPVLLPDGLHWDTLRLWHDIQEGISSAIRKTDGNVISLGVDTWGVDFGLLDGHGGLISNPFHYRDNRTDGKMEAAFRLLPREEIFNLTGIQFMQLNTLYQLLAMVESQSPILSIASTFLTMPDLFNYWMTGEKKCEFSIATTTQCYDPRKKSWSYPLLDKLGIPSQIFPEIVPPGTILGKLREDITRKFGGHQITVVAPACHDTGSAVAAVPASKQDYAWISSGTWSIMGINSPEPIITKQSLDYNFTNEGGLGGSFRFSKNIMGLWLVQECRRTWAAMGNEYSYSTLTELAEKAPSHLSVIDPDHDEFLKPGDMPSRIREYCRRTGQKIPENEGQTIRIVLESLALKYRWVLERLEELTGKKLDSIHIIGGGTRNQLLSQFTADATRREVVTGPVEATAIGNILSQAIALNYLHNLEEAQSVVRASFKPMVFTPKNQLSWDSAYQKLLEIMK